MQTLTIQQAIYKISVLRSQLDRELPKFNSEFRIPIAVNGKYIVNDEKTDKVHATIDLITQLKTDMTTLKTAIHHKNSTATIAYEGQHLTISEALETVKLDRNIYREIDNYTEFGFGHDRIKTVAGVGVVEEGIIAEEDIKAYTEALRVKCDQLSMMIDTFNSTETIEVELISGL